MKLLRDLITKKGEKNPSKILADFLFSRATQATYLGVLETIQSLALGSKPGSQEDDFIFRPENRGFEPLDKIGSGCQPWWDGNSNYCVLTWYEPSLVHRGRRFENQKLFHLNVDENRQKFDPQSGPKKMMCHHLPPTFNGFSNKYYMCRKPKKIFGTQFFAKSEKTHFLDFRP